MYQYSCDTTCLPTGYEPGTRYIGTRQKASTQSSSETKITNIKSNLVIRKGSASGFRIRSRSTSVFPHSVNRLRIRLSIFGPQAPHPSLRIRSIIPSGDVQSRSYKHSPRKDKAYPHSNFPSLPILQASKPPSLPSKTKPYKQAKNKTKTKAIQK